MRGGAVRSTLVGVSVVSTVLVAQNRTEPGWARVQEETIQHFQALLRMDTSDPPGNERPAAEYLKQALEREGIPGAVVRIGSEPRQCRRAAQRERQETAAAHHGAYRRRDGRPEEMDFPPFSATRDGGYVYGRGAIDDKDNVVAALMTMVTLKRMNVALDRDVIFLAEAGEEGTTRVGIQYMVQRHFSEIDAEFCYAEGGDGGAGRGAGSARRGPDGREDSILD